MVRSVAREKQKRLFEEPDAAGEIVSYTAVLLTQGRHRFYTLAMPSEVLASTCMVDPRIENPIDGFQRLLEQRRAQEIADYIDSGFGTIPSSIILSAQPEAELEYVRKTRTLKFRKVPRAFLVIDGQHRVYGFQLANETLRVPVVIYNNLTRSEECRLFIDINTKQRPVPSELLLDIKRLAETESDMEALFRDVFDLFHKESDSPLLGLLSPAVRAKGKISRVTFNAGLKAIWDALADSDAESVYRVLSSYIYAWLAGLRAKGVQSAVTNPTLFRTLLLLFPNVAERVSDRYNGEYTVENFAEVLDPLFVKVKKSEFQRPGNSPHALHESFRKSLVSGFSLGKTAN